jgi:hypothetical protein
MYTKKPHYHLLVPAFICCIKIHFICPFHRVPIRHPHPPSSPSVKQDHSISLTGTSITIPSCLSGHAITPCPTPTSYLCDHTITPCPTLWLLPTFIIFTWIFHNSSFNLHPLHLDIQWFLHTITSLVVPMGTDLHLCIGPRQTLQRFHLSSISARVLWDEWAVSV